MQYFCYLVGQLTSQKTTQKNPQLTILHTAESRQSSRAQRRRVEIMKSAGDEEPHVQMTDEGIRTHISYHTSHTNTHVCTQNYRVNLRQSNWTMSGMIHDAWIIKYFRLWEPLKNKHVVIPNWYHNSSYGRGIWYMLIFCLRALRQSNYSALFLAVRDLWAHGGVFGLWPPRVVRCCWPEVA